ncbi:TonB-dependent receptor [Niastella caeni]|uniref:TonB-dependent receptor n=1 Tax=Niastella caeni TaxID=2569763 RepID=A0A4S8HI21_9BACT|nr:TonB-dependent receptor [Niastella caeni]THU34858.1 TonB-dependent receptor [Niastella caeni]
MRKTYFLALLVLCSSFFSAAYAQTISGGVFDKATQEPIPGASVITMQSRRGTTTSTDGKFTIELEGDKAIEVSYAGYQPYTIILTTATFYKIELQASTLDQVVVVGYGTQKKANLTGAVSSVDIKKTFGSRPVTDISRGLQGVVPGLTITTASGELGNDPKIRLRGLFGSINTGTGGAKPLILVDNVEIPSLQMIDPDDIESISVLKDAASASIYGTRGAFGVVLITTKSGKKGSAARVTYSNNFAWSKAINTVQLAPAASNAEASLLAIRRFNPNRNDIMMVGTTYIDSLAITKIRDWEEQYGGQELSNEMEYGRDFEIRDGKIFFYRPWNPGKMYIKDWTLQQRHNIGISGGSERTTYNLGLGYMGQEGVLKVNPDKFSRYNFTLGVNTSANNWLDVRGKIIYSNTRYQTPFIFSPAYYGPWYYLYRWPAIYPYGTYEGKPFRSAVTEVEQAKMDQNKTGLARISVGGTIKPFKGLTIDADYTYTSTNEHLNQTGGGTMAWDFWALSNGKMNYTNYQQASFNKARWYSYWSEINTGKVFATYSKNIGDHALKVIAGGDIELFKNNSQSSEKSNLVDPDYGSLSLTTGTPLVDGANGHWSTLGFFGRINYAYQNKYLLELNGRYDGSSRFPANNLWGFFPSMSLGYVLTEESFMNAVRPYLSFLKVRASYGSIGNQAVGNNRFRSIMDPSLTNWLLPGGNTTTLSTPGALSPNLTWETVKTADVGVDARFFDNKLGVTFDWFQRTTSNMISTGSTLPSSYGTTAPVRNFGELQGKGWELAVDFTHTLSNGLHFTVTGTLSDAVEKITRFANTTKSLPASLTALNLTYYEGMTIGEIWGYETDRLFQESDFSGQDANGKWIYKAEVPSQTKLESGAFYYGPGDVKYKDLDGDNVIYHGTNTVGDAGDKKIIGNSTPRYQYGFRIDADWKGFDLALYLQGVAKRDLWASGPIVFPGFRASEAWYSHQMDYWTASNTGAFYPRPTDYSATIDRWNYLPQTRYLLNLSYLRVKNLSLGYALPKKLISKAGIQRVRVYVSAENLITFDKLGDIPIDPEIDFTQNQIDRDRAGFGRSYPYRTTLSAGLQVTF